MDILARITNNEIYKAIMSKTINNIIKGEKISDAFKDHWAVPEVAYYMIVTGESTGQLADMMQKVSDYYQQEHKTIVSALKSLIEPIMIVFLALIVGAIILAVIVPMFSMYDNIL
jgi:type IV pilus assembly protein PilC